MKLIQKVENGKTPLLQDIAYEKIKQRILEETFEPGSVLSERELINLLNMSKTPIKSALVRLEAEGFVEISSKRGVFILDLTIDQIIDIYNLRTALETFICEQITGKLTSKEIEEIKINLEKTKNAVDLLDVNEFTKFDHEFHLILSKIYGNKEIHEILLNRQDHLKRITLKHLKKDPHRMKHFYQEHVEITKKLKEGSKESISIMRDHLQKSKETLFN